MKKADIEDREDCVKAIAEAHGGKILGRNGHTLTVEIPDDVAAGIMRLFGAANLVPIFRRHEFRTSPERRAYFVYEIDLSPHDLGKPVPTVADIMRLTTPLTGAP